MYQRSVLLTVTGLALALAGAHPAAAAQVPDQNAPGQVLGRGSLRSCETSLATIGSSCLKYPARAVPELAPLAGGTTARTELTALEQIALPRAITWRFSASINRPPKCS